MIGTSLQAYSARRSCPTLNAPEEMFDKALQPLAIDVITIIATAQEWGSLPDII
jgi:hypothetical protein